jgi:hypothetical protein
MRKALAVFSLELSISVVFFSGSCDSLRVRDLDRVGNLDTRLRDVDLAASSEVEIETGGLLADNDRDVGRAASPPSIDVDRVRDRPGLGLGVILPGSWLPLLLVDKERRLEPEVLVSDRPGRR